MNIKKILNDFIIDKRYFIADYDSHIYIYSYKDLLKISDKEIKIRFESFIFTIKGIKLKITKMSQKELVISGEVNLLGKTYE